MDKHARVLLGCQDGQFARLACGELEREGFRVDRATTFRQIDKLLAGRHHHVLVADLDTIGHDAHSRLQEICQRDTDLAVVVLSNQPSVEAAVHSLHSGAADYLCKPVTPARLCQAIKQSLVRKGITPRKANAILKTIGQRLRERRQERSLTLRQVARRTGLSVSLISQIERAESAASVSSLHRIASSLNTPLAELFEGL
ncbi:MAG: two-component system response regulator [Deltaproteobacteria bacterium]|nr:MAG: two-component system response regulator [Deltaproteobacteria bacterium]